VLAVLRHEPRSLVVRTCRVAFSLASLLGIADAGGMHEDTERCVRAVRSKDARFDGWFYTAVTLHWNLLPAELPGHDPPAGEHAVLPQRPPPRSRPASGPAKRCRPDASPGSPEWNVRADLTGRAMRLIADGVIDQGGVPGLARRLGYSVRQLERQLVAELGAGPLALARAQRAQTARLLIETTALPMGDIAFAAGFASIRTFNDTVREVFALSPSELRARAGRGEPPAAAGALFAAAAVPRPAVSRQPVRAPGGHGRARRGGMAGRRLPADAAAAARAGRGRAAPRRRSTSPASSPWPTCATWPRPSAVAGACSTWTMTRWPWLTCCAPDPVLTRCSTRPLAGAYRARSTRPSSPSAPSWASRYR